MATLFEEGAGRFMERRLLLLLLPAAADDVVPLATDVGRKREPAKGLISLASG